MKRLLLALVLGLPAAVAIAQEAPVVELSITPETVSVGEAATMRVTVLVPTWFVGAPQFPSFEIPNTITTLPPNSSRSTSRRINGEQWSGVTRNYRIYPLMSVTYRFGGQPIQLQYANPGKDPSVANLSFPEATLLASVPAGAEGLNPYLAGSRFNLRRELSSNVNELKAGDALVVTYSAELDGLPAIFLPPVAPQVDSDIASVYADEPVVNDEQPAVRSEKVTYVPNYGGEILLPAISWRWWNTATQAVETATIEALTVTVSGPARQPLEESAEADRRSISLLIAGTAILLWLLRRQVPRILEKRRMARRHYEASEPCAFAQLVSAVRTGDNKTIYHSMLNWLDRLAPGQNLHTFAACYGGTELTGSINMLSTQLYSGGKSEFDSTAFIAGVKAARDAYIARQQHASGSLAALNP